MSKYSLLIVLSCILFLSGCKKEPGSTADSGPPRKTTSGESSDRSATSPDPFVPRDPLADLTDVSPRSSALPDGPFAVVLDESGRDSISPGSAFSRTELPEIDEKIPEKESVSPPSGFAAPESDSTTTQPVPETEEKTPEPAPSVWNIVPLDDVGKTSELEPDVNAMPVLSPSETDSTVDGDPISPSMDIVIPELDPVISPPFSLEQEEISNPEPTESDSAGSEPISSEAERKAPEPEPADSAESPLSESDFMSSDPPLFAEVEVDDSPSESAPVFVEAKTFDEPVKPSGSGAKFTEAKLFSDPVVDEKINDEKPKEAEKVSTVTGTEKTSSKDPLAELFVDWPEPKLLLVFTGFLNGYVEPCGCAGMEQMKGGLSRRHALFKALEQKGWPVLAVDAGNLNKGFGRQEELKFNFVIDESLRLMKYGAVGMGNRELLMPTDELIVYTVDIPGDPKRYTSANTAVLAFDPSCTAPYRVLEKDGIKVGVVSVLGSSHFKEINNQDIKFDDPVKRLKIVLPQLIAEECDRTVLIVHGTTQETNQILQELPDRFDFVIGSDTPAEPPLRPNWVENSMMVEVGEKGKFVVAVGLFDDKETPWRYQRIPLDARFSNSRDIVDLMKFYQEELEKTGLEGLGIKPITDRRTAENGKYIGSKACADCHEPSFDVWKKSRHAAAWKSLAETSQPARTHDPECIACHVVGWNPTEFLPYENGFLGAKRTPLLLDVGCESCHGPGENHAKAEQPGGDETLRLKLRQAVRLPVEGNAAKKLCIECHDGDNSPHFDFDVYWPKIVHPETEE